ncbi:MAG: hypothetical protein E7329_01355 [Clostridiales bacterium]|nr:hypothetical protein [Clostridiales bacterium]
MKRAVSVLLTLILLLACVPALADGAAYGSTLLSGLIHNCPNTGIMLPSAFNSYQTHYVLTVANWVSRPTFTPVAQDPNATIRVNGQVVRSGQASQVIPMTDEPQAVNITVTNGGASTTYTIFLQRRPSEKRTRVSSGYINNIYLKGTTWRMDADLVTMKYRSTDYSGGNYSTFTNATVEKNRYDYAVNPNCLFYFGTKQNCYRAYNIQEFMSNYLLYGSSLYSIVYMEDEIVAVFPYGADY